jgi:hypothetical protein
MIRPTKRLRTGGGEGEERGDIQPHAADASMVRLCDALRTGMGGRKYCSLKEVSRQVLLDYLIAKGDIAEVDLLEVTVQTLSGTSFEVTLEVGGNVRALKAEIETAEGTPWYRQELFELVEDAEDACEEPLADDWVVEKSCTMALCVKAPPAVEWDSDSPLLKASFCEV